MNAKEFEAGIKEVETARGKTYGDEHHDLLRALFKDFERLTGDSWLQICDVLRKLSRTWLPPLGEFWEVRHQLPNLKNERDGGRSVCGGCHEGVRFWLVKTTKDDRLAISHSTARCRCLAGDRWTAFLTMDQVEKRADFMEWVNKGIPEEAARKKREAIQKAS